MRLYAAALLYLVAVGALGVALGARLNALREARERLARLQRQRLGL